MFLKKKEFLKALLILFFIFVHILSFSLSFDYLGLTGIIFAAIPIVVAAWAFGRVGGGVISFLMLVINIVLISQLSNGEEPNNIGLIIDSIFLVLVGFFVGWITDKDEEMRKELRERRKAEEKLTEAELWYRSIFDGVNDAVLVETINGDVLDINLRACEIFGWTREEFLTKKISDMVPPEFQALLPEEQNENNFPEAPLDTGVSRSLCKRIFI